MLVVLVAGFSGCAHKKAAVKKSEGGAAAASVKSITGIEISGDAKGAVVTVKGNNVLDWADIKAPFASGIVLYFSGTALDGVLPEYVAEKSIIERVSTSQSPEAPPASRVEISLRENLPYTVEKSGNDVRVVIGSGQTGAPSARGTALPPPEEAPMFEAIEPAIAGGEDITSAGRAAAGAAAASPGWAEGPALLAQVHFLEEEAGRSTIRVETNRPVAYNVLKNQDKRLVIEIPNTEIPREQQRPLITTRFVSAVDRITPVARPDGAALVVIELREAVPYHVQQTGNEIFMHVDPSSIPPRPLAEAGLPPMEAAMSTLVGEWEQQFEEYDDSDEVELAAGEQKKFTGEKIALEFYKSDIKNVFQILKEVSGLNFAIDTDVTGEVTLSLHRPVPWDQVLELILRMNNLGMERDGDIVRIASKSTLDAELAAKSLAQEEKLKAMEADKELEALVTEYIPVNYSTAEAMKAHVDEVKTEKRGKVSIDARTNTIIMTDTREKIRAAREIVERLDKVTPQVTIEARIVEASTAFTRQIGIEWGGESGIQPGDSREGIGPQRGYDVLGGTYGYNWNVNFPVSSDGNQLGINFTRLMGLTPLTLNATLTAMETRGEGKIISNPKIVTLDNKKALIKQGISYPYTWVEDGKTTTSFKDVDLKLEVTPHVTPDHRVSMSINTTKNDLGEIILGRQSFITKEANTELLVNDGDTVVIGGIIKTRKSESQSGWPFLSRVPGLGWLFKNNAYSNSREELLIFITPKIVDLEAR